MQIQRFEFNLFGENTYVIWDSTTRECAVVDPGMSDRREAEILTKFILDKNLRLKYILLTHAHIDHTFGVEVLKEMWPEVAVGANMADQPLALTRSEQARMFHLPVNLGTLQFDLAITENTPLSLGSEKITTITTPGHSPGGVCYYVADSGFILTGDTLFAGSIGRTDLPGGNSSMLLQSIRRKLLTLPPETLVFPGHGPTTSIEREEHTNPFLH